MTIPMQREWAGYKALVSNLIGLRTELAETQSAEKQQRLEVYMRSGETSVSAKDREADYPTLELAQDIIGLKAEIAGKEDLRDMLVLAIQAGVEVLSIPSEMIEVL